MKVLQFPLARVTLSFIPGIILAFYLNPYLTQKHVIFFFAPLLFVVFVAIYLHKKHRNKVYFGWAIYLVSFSIGALTQIIHTENVHPLNYSNKITDENRTHVLDVVLREKLKTSVNGERYIGIVRTLDGSKATGKILLNFLSKSRRNHPIGSELSIQVKINKSRKPLNPDQFDYGKYLEKKSIYAQAKVDDANILSIAPYAKDLWYYSDLLRRRMINNLRESGFGKDELAVLTALILGQQQEISANILQDYQYAGAIHILSVSGLHVGFILLFLNFTLKWLPSNRRGAQIKFVIVLCGLWGFALIAGFSPSVVRSATMFSVVAWGLFLRRSTNIFHTLLVSLLLILLFRPSFLFDVGFQLSYTALFFILWLQPLLIDLWKPKYKILEYFWSILTVSVAAQIGAFPLSVYYFHQFPALFFVTNLFIIPFLGVIMSLGVLVLISAGSGYVPKLLAEILEWCIYVINEIVAKIASYEDFIIPDIPFNIYMLLTCYLMIVTVSLWFVLRKYRPFVLAILSILVFQTSMIWSRVNTAKKKELIVFNMYKKTLITERYGSNVKVYTDVNEINTNQTVKAYLIANFCEIKESTSIENFIAFNGRRILIIDSASVYPKIASIDALILIQSPKINLQRFVNISKPTIVIADGSNYKSYIKKWEATCANEKIPFHYTGEKGFYKISGKIKL